MPYVASARVPATWLKQLLALAAVFCVALVVDVFPSVIAWLAPLNVVVAQVTSALVNWFGMPVTSEANFLFHPAGFGYEIDAACTGLIPTLVSIVTLACLPLSTKQCILAISLGILFTQSINLLRLVALFYVGVHHLSTFKLTHDWLGQGLIIVTTAAFLAFWIRTSRRG